VSYSPGELDQYISIERLEYSSDGQGGQNSEVVSMGYDINCKSRPMTGNESERYDKMNPTKINVFVIRYRDDLKETDTILWYGTKYNIRYIKDFGERSLYLEIFAEAGEPI
tara:strand:+ start:6062 stop:6394 length:333 start_codon:yes stop_codon:yes gene_type:complete